MRILVTTAIAAICLSCNHNGETERLQSEVDTLKRQLADSYRPGLGEFMTSIQIHHNKLWFAGQAENWELADFEIHEITEALDDIKKYNTDRPEIASIKMIEPAIDSLNKAIAAKDAGMFRQHFITLTNTCNNCHRATKHEFNVIKLPETPLFSNQEFRK